MVFTQRDVNPFLTTQMEGLIILRARITRNIALLLIGFLIGILILTQTVSSDSDSGHDADIMWDIYVGSLSHEDSETYSSHSYQIELYDDIPAGVKATYEFAHFVHDLTLGIIVRETKVLKTGKKITQQYEWDGKSQGLGASVYGLDPDHRYELEGYTRLEIRKGVDVLPHPEGWGFLSANLTGCLIVCEANPVLRYLLQWTTPCPLPSPGTLVRL